MFDAIAAVEDDFPNAFALLGDIAEKLSNSEPTTPDGCKAKIKAIIWAMADGANLDTVDTSAMDYGHRMSISLARDILRIG